MIKTLFFLLNILLGGQQTTPQMLYSNPMDGFVLHTRSEHGNTNAQAAERTFAEEEDSKSDSDDSDDEFNPLDLLKIYSTHAENNFSTSQKKHIMYVGELSPAYLPPILSPPDKMHVLIHLNHALKSHDEYSNVYKIFHY
ncbi:hypothetical protein [Aquirufa regiilacus]|jgi:hypothetical protein|nr:MULTISPECIES: hypothetical protein [unclassified Aquirufa]MDT8886478.1 hypothetical protein [Aquirufa sp. LEPPI-3A]